MMKAGGQEWRSSDDERIRCYSNYRIEKDGIIITPTIASWLAEESVYHLTYWTTTYSAKFVVENEFVFIHVHQFPMSHKKRSDTYYLLLSDQRAETLASKNELFNSDNNHVYKDIKPTKETCGPALQIELADGNMRWLFKHPDGQRAAWEQLLNTTP